MWGLFSQLCSENHYFLQNMKKVIFKNCAEKCRDDYIFLNFSVSVIFYGDPAFPWLNLTDFDNI